MPALVFIISLLAISCTSYASAIPSFEARYNISKGVLKLGEMSRRMRVDENGSYQFESTMRSKGLVSLFAKAAIEESSQGVIIDGRLQPTAYSYSKGSNKKDFSLSFDHSQATVTTKRANGELSSLPLPVATMDKLVYQAQLMLDLPAEPQSLNYSIADRGKIKQYAIDILGQELVTTGLGEFPCVKVQRVKKSGHKTTVWYAQELSWMPVRVEHEDKDGGTTVAVLQQLTLQDKLVAPR